MVKKTEINDLEKKYGSDAFVSAEDFMNEKRIVIPVSPKLDMILDGGIPEGSFVILAGPPKIGKEQPIDELVCTPNGWKEIGKLQINDKICNPFGSYSKVIGIYPQGKKDVYKVTFADGGSTECGIDHLWEVKSRDRKNRSILTTKEIMDSIWSENGKRPRWSIITSKCEFNKQNLLIHPYVMGVLLGDGSLSTTGRVGLTNSSIEVVDKVNSLLDDGFYFKHYNVNIEYNLITSQQPNKYAKYIEELGINTLSINKKIPYIYKYSSIEDRIELLKGLMDTDGYIQKGGQTEFYSSSKELASDVRQLVLSIGGTAKLRNKWVKYKGEKRLSYAVTISLDDKSNLFYKPEKLSRVKKRVKKPIERRIVDISYSGNKECVCIEIDHPRHLYVTRDFIATHNTLTSLHFAANAQLLGRKVYYLNIEGRLKPRDLQGIPKLQKTEDKFEIVRSFKKEDGSSRILLAHEYLDIAESKIKNEPGCIIIVDSASQLLTETEEQGELGQQHRAPGAVLLAQFCKKIANTLPVSGCIIIMIVHVVANTGGGMKKKSRTGGNKIQYAVDVDLECTYTEKWKVGGGSDDESGTEIGKKIHWVTGSTAGNAAPGMETISYLRYGIGIDEIYELFDLAKTTGLIERAGAWYALNYLESKEEKIPKIQGEERVMELLNSNEEYVNILKDRLKGMLG